MRISLKLLIYLSLFFIPYIHFIGVEQFPTWRFFNIIFVLSCFFYYRKINKKYIPVDFLFLLGIFFLAILAQFFYLILEDRIGFYEPFFLFSLFFLFSFAFFLFVLLHEDRIKTLKTIIYSIVLMISYQIFQFIAYVLGYRDLTKILNQIDIDKIAVFYKIVGTVMGPPSFLSESGMLALYLGPIFGIFLVYERFGIYKPSKLFYAFLFLGLVLTLSGGAFLEFTFLTVLILTMNLSKISLRQYLIIFGAFFTIIWLLATNPSYYILITDRANSLFSGRSGRMEGAAAIMDIFYENNIFFGIAPKSGRFFDADQNMLLPMLLTDHGLIGTFAMSLILILPYLSSLFFPKRALLLIPYTGFLIHLFLAYGTYLWSYLWIIYILVLYGITLKSDTDK